jgi:hypothetical protein
MVLLFFASIVAKGYEKNDTILKVAPIKSRQMLEKLLT